MIDPIGATPEDALSIKIIQIENGYEYVYRFTWNGDKLIEGEARSNFTISTDF